MKLSRKFDIYTIIITVIFLLVFFVSLNTIYSLSRETSNLLDISFELDYLTNLKNALINLEHSMEHHLNILPGSGYTEGVKNDLSDLERILQYSTNVKLDDEEKQIIKNITTFAPAKKTKRSIFRDLFKIILCI